MRNTLLVLLLIILLIGIFLVMRKVSQKNSIHTPYTKNIVMEQHLTLTSGSFVDGGTIPSRYTCDGENLIPPLEISGVPEKTASLVLIMDDPDIPYFVKEERGIEVFDHWVLFNLKPTIRSIEEGIQPEGGSGVNSAGNSVYTGPCPPDGEHRYFFKLYALDTVLTLPERSTKKEVEDAMDSHIIEETQLLGRYKRG
jgi:hypothetical protein